MVVLHATERKMPNKSELKQLRNSGGIPAVLYGKNVPQNISLTLDAIEFRKHLRENGKNSLFRINVNGKQQNVVVKDIQEDLLNNQILHVDLMAVDESTEIETTVGVNLVGEPIGVKEGGVLQQVIYELAIRAKADQLPETIDIDITNLNVSENITVGDISANYPFTFSDQDHDVIVTILPPKQEEVIHTGEKQTPAEPEDVEVRES